MILLDGERVATGAWRPGTHRRDANAVVDGLLESLIDALALLRYFAGLDDNDNMPPVTEFLGGTIEHATKVIQAIPANDEHWHFWSLPGTNGRTCLFCAEGSITMLAIHIKGKISLAGKPRSWT